MSCKWIRCISSYQKSCHCTYFGSHECICSESARASVMYPSGLEYLASQSVCILGTCHPNEIFHPVFPIALHSCPVGTKRKKGLGYKSRIIAPLGSPPSSHPPFLDRTHSFYNLYKIIHLATVFNIIFITRIILSIINMARFSLSFFSVFLVLAAFAMSMPTKREQSPGLGLGNLFTPLQVSAHDLIFTNYPC